MGFDIRHRHEIAAPIGVVWGLLADFSTWPRWWPDCAAAHRPDRRPLAEGATVELVISPSGRERAISGVVDLISEGRSLTLVGKRFLFQATVTWTFREGTADTTRMSIHGAFEGLAAGRFGPGKDVLETSLRRLGRGLMNMAERTA